MYRTKLLVSAAALLLGGATAVTFARAQTTDGPDTIFGNATPAVAASPDSNGIEVGVQFASTEAGTVTGIRFYKGRGNSGTHIGSLWTASGKLLAQATFTNETRSGWQTVAFASPVAIAANKTYVAAYYAPTGHYAVTVHGLASGFSSSSSPLRALSNSVSSNGIYRYSASSTFPTNAWQGDNYWVDATFVPSDSAGAGVAPRSPATSPGSATPVNATPAAASALAASAASNGNGKHKGKPPTPPTTTTTTTTPSTTTPSTTTTTPSTTTTTPSTTTPSTTTTTPSTTTTTPSTTTTTPSSSTSGCFLSPGSCGYPDPAYGWNSAGAWQSGGGGVGPNNGTSAISCSSLTPSGSITASTAGQTISKLNVTGSITVTAPNVTIDDVCVTDSGGSGVMAISTSSSSTLIENSTIAGAGAASPQSIEAGVFGPATLVHDYLYNEADPVELGRSVSDSYLIVSGTFSGAHYEDIYGNDQAITVTHDTLLNPENQTAEVFDNTQNSSGQYTGPCSNTVTITGSLLAGGGYTIYACGNATSVGSSTMNVSNNVFARCTTPPINLNAQQGGYACGGSTSYSAGSGADNHGYWPYGGYYGVAAYTFCGASGQTWQNNVWGDNRTPVSC